MDKFTSLSLLLFLPNIVMASSYTTSDGVQSLTRIFGGLLLGFMNSGEYLLILGVVFTLFILVVGFFLFIFLLSLSLIRKFCG